MTVLVLAGLAARLGSFPLGFPQFLLCGWVGVAGSGAPLAATCLPRGRQPEVPIVRDNVRCKQKSKKNKQKEVEEEDQILSISCVLCECVTKVRYAVSTLLR